MSEAELVNAVSQTITLAYLPAQWWLAASTGLILAMHFAARQVAAWLFWLVIVLYIATSMSAVFEVAAYSQMAESYAARLEELRAASHIAAPAPAPPWVAAISVFANFMMFVVGSLAAIAYAWATWRASRSS